MSDSFNYNDTFNSSEDRMEDLFPSLNQEDGATFNGIAIGNDIINTTEHQEIDSPQDDTTFNNQDTSSNDLLWRDVDNLSIPDFRHEQKRDIKETAPGSSCSSTTQNDNSNTTTELMMSNASETISTTSNNNNHQNNNVITTTPQNDSSSASSSLLTQQQQDTASGVFNISWGGSDDKPPAELHLEHSQESELVSRRPLPKPRGVKRLPEPEPAEDGTVDEDTLRRRRNTYAARRSRMKKFLKIENLENRVNQLQTENAKLVLNNALLESEKRGWVAKEAEYKKRIKLLEGSSGQSSVSSTPPTDIQEQME